MWTSCPPRKTWCTQKTTCTTTQRDSTLPLHSQSTIVMRNGSCPQNMVRCYYNLLAGDLMKKAYPLQNESHIQAMSVAMRSSTSTARTQWIPRAKKRSSSSRTRKQYLSSRSTRRNSCALTRRICSFTVTLTLTMRVSSTFSSSSAWVELKQGALQTMKFWNSSAISGSLSTTIRSALILSITAKMPSRWRPSPSGYPSTRSSK